MHSGIQCNIVLSKRIDLAKCYDLASLANKLLNYLEQIVRPENKNYLGSNGFVILQLSEKRSSIAEGGNFYLRLIAVDRNEENIQHIYHEVLRGFYRYCKK